MNPELLAQLGLSPSQAKAYVALIEKGEQTPPVLAKHIHESRSNTYMILDRLAELGLCKKIEDAKQLRYSANNPVALEALAESRRKDVAALENSVKQSMPVLLSYYYSFTERPGIRLVEGQEGLKEIYRDTLRAKEPIYLVRTPAETEYLGQDFIQKYISKRQSLKIPITALTPDVPSAIHDKEVDKQNLFTRTWMSPSDYTAPVEISVYGNKVAFSAFGNETMGVIIDNPSIAEAMRQLFELSSAGATARRAA